MIFLGELRVEAIDENLRVISAFLHGVAQRLKLTDKVLFDIDLALEEAAVNIVRHAYSDEYSGDILLTIDLIDDSLRLTLTDWGKPFDAKEVKPFDIDAPVEARIQGGMGLYFIENLMDDVSRRIAPRLGIPNTLTLVKHIAHERTQSDTPRTLRERNAMMSVGRFLAAKVPVNDLLSLIVSELVETIGAERGTLYLVNPEREELYSQVFSDNVGDLRQVRVRLGEGIAGHVAQTGQLVNIIDAYQDSRFNPAIDQQTGYRTRSMLVAPLHNHVQQIIGVVQLINKKDGYFNSRDERLLIAMAAQAAVSIENAQLHAQEINQRLIRQQLETARTIQQSFLPDNIPQVEGWDIATFWKPMEDVGGDFFTFQRLQDGRLGFVIADVSGKGIPAALFMAFSETVLSFGMTLNISPSAVLELANRYMFSNQRSRMFTTAFVGYLDRHSLEYACAGHNPPLLFRANERRFDYLSASGVALGIFENALFGTGRTYIEADEVLVVYTDGITEAIDVHEEEFSEKRLEQVIAANASEPAHEICDKVVTALATFVGEQPSFDDEALIVFKSE